MQARRARASTSRCAPHAPEHIPLGAHAPTLGRRRHIAAPHQTLLTVRPLVRLWRARRLTAAAAPQWGPLAFHKKSLLNLGEAMRRTRKLCAVMVDVVGREIVLNRPSKVLRRPLPAGRARSAPAHSGRRAPGRRRPVLASVLVSERACRELLQDTARLVQVEEDGWPRFENPISVKATDKVRAAVPRPKSHAGLVAALPCAYVLQ